MSALSFAVTQLDDELNLGDTDPRTLQEGITPKLEAEHKKQRRVKAFRVVYKQIAWRLFALCYYLVIEKGKREDKESPL